MSVKQSSSIAIEIPSEVLNLTSLLYKIWVNTADLVVIIVAIGVSLFGWKYYFDHNLILAYNDSMSHLDIARRVVDGLKPGFAQIGSVWLPLPHLLMLPFVWSNFLWHTGLAGSFTSILAFVGSAYLMYKIVFALTKSYPAAILGFLIFAINPNMVYMQAIPMTESLLIFLSLGSFYFALLWEKTNDYRNLIITAFFILLATLTRYDGWMLLAQIAPIIFIISWRRKGLKSAESNLILFMTLAFYGVILWLLWNLLIFHDPLYFANGPFSAKAQQMVFDSEGKLFSKGNVIYSIYIYTLAVIRNNGAIITLFAGVGAVYYFVKNRLSNQALVMTLLFSPLIFNVLALFTGNSIINLPDIPPYTLFNVRYGLMLLPSIAIFIAYLSKKKFWLIPIVILTISFQAYFMYRDSDVITVTDGQKGASAQNMSATGRWLKENVDGSGLILIAASSEDSLIFQSSLPMSRFIHEGTGQYWDTSLDNPTKYAEYVAMHHGDLVYQRLFDNENFLKNYEKVYDGDFTDIYKLSLNRNKPMTAADLP